MQLLHSCRNVNLHACNRFLSCNLCKTTDQLHATAALLQKFRPCCMQPLSFSHPLQTTTLRVPPLPPSMKPKLAAPNTPSPPPPPPDPSTHPPITHGILQPSATPAAARRRLGTRRRRLASSGTTLRRPMGRNALAGRWPRALGVPPPRGTQRKVPSYPPAPRKVPARWKGRGVVGSHGCKRG